MGLAGREASGAVEEDRVGQVEERRRELGGVVGGLQALDERRGPGHPVRPPRRFRWVRVTWSDLTSSGGVRYPQASAPSWR